MIACLRRCDGAGRWRELAAATAACTTTAPLACVEALCVEARRCLARSPRAVTRAAVFDALRLRAFDGDSGARSAAALVGNSVALCVVIVTAAEGVARRVSRRARDDARDDRAHLVEREAALRLALRVCEAGAFGAVSLARSIVAVAGGREEPARLRRAAILGVTRLSLANVGAFERLAASGVLVSAALDPAVPAVIAEQSVLALVSVCEAPGDARARRRRVDAVLSLLSPFTDLCPDFGAAATLCGGDDDDATTRRRRERCEHTERWDCGRRALVALCRHKGGLALLATEPHGLAGLARAICERRSDARLQFALVETVREVLEPVFVAAERAATEARRPGAPLLLGPFCAVHAAAFFHAGLLHALGALAVSPDRVTVSDCARAVWLRLSRLCRLCLARATVEDWLATEPLRLHALARGDARAVSRCEDLLCALCEDAQVPARLRRALCGEARDDAAARRLRGRAPDVPVPVPVESDALGGGGGSPRRRRRPSQEAQALSEDLAFVAGLRRAALRPWVDLSHTLCAERCSGLSFAQQSDEGDCAATCATRRVLEVALQDSLANDERSFAALLARTKVLETKDWRAWDWRSIDDAVTVLRRGSSLKDSEIRVDAARLRDALKGKFVRRIGGFFRCDSSKPCKASFATLPWFFNKPASQSTTLIVSSKSLL